MTYYEELGVSPAASADEIRHAYKTLARLLHPDPIGDEHLKQLAELQMRRLNHILAVLTDPAARRRYNMEMEGLPLAAVARRAAAVPVTRALRRSRWRSLAIGICAWLPPAAGAALLVAALLYTGAGTPPPVSKAADPAKITPSVAPAPPPLNHTQHSGNFRGVQQNVPAALRVGPQTGADRPAPRPRDARPLPPAPVIAAGAPPVALPAVLTTVVPEPGPVPASAVRAPVILSAAPARNFGGNWFYVPRPQNTSATSLYPPEYIELRLTENRGVLRGRYRARYRVSDQAISPVVDFQFEGRGSLPKAELPWSGVGVAKGTITLRLLAPDQLQVSWIATQLSEGLDLVSGEAELIREQGPR